MKDNSYLPDYGDDDVLMFNETTMLKVAKFRNAVKNAFNYSQPQNLHSTLVQQNNINVSMSNCFTEGVKCEALKIGSKGWKKGKMRIRVSLEFCPDEPDIEEALESNQLVSNQSESPLDDIRQMMNGNS